VYSTGVCLCARVTRPYSVTDGASFMSMSKVVSGQGACVLVVRTGVGDVFGAFVSHGFQLGPLFVGDERTFLFTLTPHIRNYTASGYNHNYAYLNAHTKTMPNGLVSLTPLLYRAVVYLRVLVDKWSRCHTSPYGSTMILPPAAVRRVRKRLLVHHCARAVRRRSLSTRLRYGLSSHHRRRRLRSR
jgi:hypothetical protein